MDVIYGPQIENGMKRAVYAGSFDMPTKGHESVIKQAANIFDELLIAIALNPLKKTMFTKSERREMLSDIVMDYKNVTVTYFHITHLHRQFCGATARTISHSWHS